MELLREKYIDFNSLFNSTESPKYTTVKEKHKTTLKEKHKITNEEWETCKSFFDYCCAYCGHIEDKTDRRRLLIKEHVDNFGSNYLDNCVPACLSCNSTKRSKKFEVWYKTSPNFSEKRLQKVYQWLNSH